MTPTGGHDDLATLELVFTRHLVDQMVRADRDVQAEELESAERICPSEPLRVLGLLDPDGLPTPAFEAACTAALDRLPGRLPLDRKLAIITRLLEVGIVDGRLHRDEGSLLFHAARLLGISHHDFDQHLDTLEQVGSVELG